METYKFKDIDFLITTDKIKIVPFVKTNENRAIKLILNDKKLIRNTKKAISVYLGSNYKIIDSFTIAGIIAKFKINANRNCSSRMLIDSVKIKQIEIFKSEVNCNTLSSYINSIQEHYMNLEPKELEIKEL